ncbi:MAG: 2-oxoglutarate dehydrogenase complex dihydrolipoyllysine-residue succinyltransferase [Bacteroidales bacterium]
MIEVKIPSPGESISQVQLASRLVKDNDYVYKDDEIAEIDSDKASLSISAGESGKITFMAEEGDTLEVGAVVAKIDTSAEPPTQKRKPEAPSETAKEQKTTRSTDVPPGKPGKHETEQPPQTSEPSYINTEGKSEKTISVPETQSKGADDLHMQITPLARQILKEKGITPQALEETIKTLKIGRNDIETAAGKIRDTTIPSSGRQQEKPPNTWGEKRDTQRRKMSTLRKKITERLVSVKNETAMLTTFNEVNMEAIMNLRNKYKAEFLEKHGVKPGIISFFTMAAAQALQHFPGVNAQIQEEELVYYNYADIGIAVSTPKGLMVPVLRNAHQMNLAEIELGIKEKAEKAKNRKLSVDEMQGGTFSITNGGVFGSMLSTPIINPPQSAILGLHNIQERPVALHGQVQIKPMMYIALSYDHRVIDGKESVSFLVKIKEIIENPIQMLHKGNNPERQLLDL